MQTTNLELPFILPAQAQKHVTHNEALLRLDALVQLSVISRSNSAPPVGALEGARFLVAAPGEAVWTGADGKIAALQDGAWTLLAPSAGWLAFVEDEGQLLLHDGIAWGNAADALIANVERLGVNATPDGVNRFAVRSPATLLDNEGADHRVAINKASSFDTASILFQQTYSGRAEIGLVGDDDFSLKTSADGVVWNEAMRASSANGRIHFPAGAGGVAIPIMGNSGANVSAGQTRFMTPGLLGENATVVYAPVPVAGRFSDLTCVTSDAPGAGESWTFTLQNLFSDTALSCVIAGTATNQGADNVNSVHFAAQARWSLKMVASPGATNSGNVLFSMLFTPD